MTNVRAFHNPTPNLHQLHQTTVDRGLSTGGLYSQCPIPILLMTRSHSLAEGIDDRETIYNMARELLSATDIDNKKIRLLGISLSNFGHVMLRQRSEDTGDQLKLF